MSLKFPTYRRLLLVVRCYISSSNCSSKFMGLTMLKLPGIGKLDEEIGEFPLDMEALNALNGE